MKRFKLYFFIQVLFCTNLFSQTPPTLQWQKCYGGTKFEISNAIKQTSDGGYIVAGYTASNDSDVSGNKGGTEDAWIIKISNTGSLQWQKCVGGSLMDVFQDVLQTVDGGYIAVGYSYSNDSNVSGNHGKSDFWIVKLSSTGSLVWQKCYGGSKIDIAYKVIQCMDGEFLIAGSTESNDSNVNGNKGNSDGWLVKVNGSGVLQWQKCFGGMSNDAIRSIQQTADSGFVFTGTTSSSDTNILGNHGGQDLWVLKLDKTINIQWQKCYGGTQSETGFSVQNTSDGGYIIAGNTTSNDGDIASGNKGQYDFWVLKLTSSGIISWQKCIGGSNMDEAYSVIQTTDGGYVVSGYTQSNDIDVIGNHGNTPDYWLVKLSSSGNILWQKCYGGSSTDIAYTLQQTSDGGLILSGESLSHDGDVFGNHGNFDFWVVKLSSITTEISETEKKNEINFYPNPSTGIFNLTNDNDEKLQTIILDMNGKIIDEFALDSRTEKQLNYVNLADGIYVVRLFNENKSMQQKFVIHK